MFTALLQATEKKASLNDERRSASSARIPDDVIINVNTGEVHITGPVELRSVKSFYVWRSEIVASVATSHGPKSGSAKPSLMMPRIRANSLSAWRETGHGSDGANGAPRRS
jgi:hypothetical protein